MTPTSSHPPTVPAHVPPVYLSDAWTRLRLQELALRAEALRLRTQARNAPTLADNLLALDRAHQAETAALDLGVLLLDSMIAAEWRAMPHDA